MAYQHIEYSVEQVAWSARLLTLNRPDSRN
jgi:hypothetical protein